MLEMLLTVRATILIIYLFHMSELTTENHLCIVEEPFYGRGLHLTLYTSSSDRGSVQEESSKF